MEKCGKKHAMLIMAHNQFEILELLMHQLDHERNDLYIHIDKKVKHFDFDHFSKVCHKSKVCFIPRMKVYWGDSTQVDCELRLIDSALKSGQKYEYLHLLSGLDLQIKKTEEIHRFFDEHPDRQFIAFRNTQSGISGISRYFFFMRWRNFNKYLAKGFDIISGYIQRLLKVNRLKNVDKTIYKTQNWFSITKDCAEYIISQREFIKNFTKYTRCGDEMFLGTVIMNSHFARQVYRSRGIEGHMRLIDRDRPEGASPHTMTIDDWNLINNCPYFWARKFNLLKDRLIIEKVFENWS